MSYYWPTGSSPARIVGLKYHFTPLFITLVLLLSACGTQPQGTPASSNLFATVTPTSSNRDAGADFELPTQAPTSLPQPITQSEETSPPLPNNTVTPTSSPTFTSASTASPTPIVIHDPAAPAIPIPLEPKAGSVIECEPGQEKKSIVLQWSPVPNPAGTISYQFRIEGGPLGPATGSTADTESLFFLDCERSYQWQVRTVDSNDTPGPWSNLQSFSSKYRDAEGPYPPSLISPGNSNSVARVQQCNRGESVPINFQWGPTTDESGVAGYFFAVRNNQDNIWQQHPDLIEGQSLTKEIECGYQYEWAIRAVDGVGNYGDWSVRHKIYVGPDESAPAAPKLRSPRNGEEYVCTAGRQEIGVDFHWYPVEASDLNRYFFHLREIYDTTKGNTLEYTSTQSHYFNYGNLPCYQANYEWQVGAEDTSGNYRWSEWARFSVSKQE